jgi:hypothetical protein
MDLHRPLLCTALLALSALPLPVAARAPGCPQPVGDVREEWYGQQAWVALQRADYRFGAFEFVIEDVYGANAEDPDAWYARALNFLHIESRQATIEPHLLFAPGSKVIAELVNQTERRLRGLKFIGEARLTPVRCADGKVDVRVNTQDTWTLDVGFDFKSVGGQTRTGILVNDSNVFGSGKTVFMRKRSDVLRDTLAFGYYDPALRGSRWTLGVEHTSQSDGVSKAFGLQRPFSTNEQLWAFRTALADSRETLSFYDAGEVAWRTRSVIELREVAAYRLLDWDGDQGWRVGLAWRESRNYYGTVEAVDAGLRPAPVLMDRERRGVVASVSRFHDHWATFRDLRNVDRTEDINLGLDGTLEIGYFPQLFTSTTASWNSDLTADWAARWGLEALLIARLEAGARPESSGGTRDGHFDFTGAIYSIVAPSRTRLVHLALRSRYKPDPEHELYLGGADGLLGYPANFVASDRAWTLHIAERIVTDKVLFQTVRVGWNLFAEAGQGRRIGGRGWSPVLMDVGGGLRLGNRRSSDRQAIYLSVGVPIAPPSGVASYAMVLGVAIDY